MSALKAKRDAEPEDDFARLAPKHWQVFRLKDKATFNPSKSEINKLPDVCTFAPMEKLKTDSLITDETTITSEISGSYTYFKEEDILVAKVTPCFENRNIAIAKNLLNGIGFGSSEINVVRVSKKANRRWFFYLFLSSEFIEAGASKMAGAGGLKRIPSLFLETFSFALPPIREQNIIAEYLDTKTAQIDRQIDLLGQKAAQYGKLKQSLINETVTCGLDKSVPMKDSGVEWIGEVPQHWAIKRLKELAFIQNSNVDKKSHDHEISVLLCNYVDVYKNEFIDTKLSKNFMTATADESEIKRYQVKKNDVLITKDSETCEDIAIPALVTETIDGVLCGYHLTQIRTDERIFIGPYLSRLFQSKSYGFRFVITAKGITRVGLGQSAIADALTPVPPLDEQKAIAKYLDEKTAQIDRVVTTINTQIDQLKDLRKALINDVVTGKIKVVSEEGQVT